MATEVNLVLGADTTQVDKGATSLDQLTAATKKTASELAALAKVEEQMWEAGTKLVLKLEDLVATFGLTTEQIYSFRAAQLGVTEAAAPLIAQLEAMKTATKAYGVVITDVSQIEAARIAWEESALTAFNAFKIRTMAENQAAEESAAAVFAAFKIRTMAENRAAAIASIDAEVEANANALRKQEADLTVFAAFKARTLAENRKEAIAILEAQEAEAIALAEKQALAEIAWGNLSVKTRIEQLERLKTYQSNPAITSSTTEKTFGSAAINDLPNLVKYQQEYATALATTATAHAGVKAGAEGAAAALGGMQVQTARATNEAVVLAREFGRGNYSRMAGSFSILAQAIGLTINPITVLAVAIGGLGYLMLKGAQEQEAMIAALKMTGNYAGTTAAGLDQLAHSATAVSGSISAAKEAVMALAGSGKFTATEIGTITDAAVAMEHTTGQSVQTTIKQFETLAVQMQGSSVKSTEAVSKAALKLDDTYHFLTESVFEQIRAFERDGQQKAASELAINSLAKVTEQRAHEMIENIGYIARAWHTVKDAIGEAISALGDWGKKATPASDVAGLQNQIKAIQTGIAQASQLSPGAGAAVQKDSYAAMVELVNKLEVAKTKLNKVNEEAAKEGERTRAMSQANHDADNITDFDNRKKEEGTNKVTAALKKYEEQLQRIKAVNPSSQLLDPAAVAAHKAALIKENTLKGSGTAKEDGFARASLQDIVGPLQQGIAAQAKILSEGQKLLDAQYAQGDISLRTYLDSEQSQRQKALETTLAYYDKEIKATERYIATVKDTTKKLAGETLLKEEINKKNQYIVDATSKDSIGAQKDQKLLQDYSDNIAKLNIQLATLQGRFLDAATAQDAMANRLNRKRLNADASSGMPGAEQALGNDTQIQKYTLGKAAVADQTEKYNLTLEKQATLEGQIALAQQKGTYGQVQGLIEVSKAREAEIAQLQNVADEMQRIAEAVGDKKMIADAQAFRLKIDQMAASADVLAIEINKLVDGPLETFFTSMMTNPRNIAGAFKAMANSIVQELDKVAAKELSVSLGFGTGGGSGGFGGLVSGLIGSFFGSGASYGAADTAQAAVGGDFQLSSAFGGAFATGGDPPVGMPSLVGEKGPELFVPKTAGTIIPNGQWNPTSSGDTTHLSQTVNFVIPQAPTRETQSQIAAATFTAGSRMARRNS